MAEIAGVDFGTLSVRVSLVDSARGLLGSAISEYPLHRKREDPDYATQSHQDQMRALASATRQAVKAGGIAGDSVAAIALDTTGSSVIPVAADMTPLDDYYLWCDHRAKQEAAEITSLAQRENLEAIQWCGGVYSSEWGFAKLLHWLRHNPGKRDAFASAFEHCDMVAATLCGIAKPSQVKRSVCAMGHKWMWNAVLGGLPPETFLAKVDPLLAGVRAKLDGEYATSDQIAGTLSPQWAEKLGLRAGIPPLPWCPRVRKSGSGSLRGRFIAKTARSSTTTMWFRASCCCARALTRMRRYEESRPRLRNSTTISCLRA